MARYFLLSMLFMLFSTMAISQTSLAGKVTEADNGEPVLFGTVALIKNGVPITGTETDFDGNYSFSNIDPGTYDVEASYVGLKTQRINGVVVFAGKTNTLDIQMGEGGITLTEVEVIAYKVPLIEKDNTTGGGVVTGEQIRTLPTKSVNGLAATVAGISSADDGGDLSIRGSRTGMTDYYIDGVRVRGNMIPQSEIDQLQVITGGIGAEYGDVAGGIISITTKGPSSKYSGGLELETSEYLDSYGYNLISGNFSGPIIKKKETGESILGFRFSGQYRTRLDDDPPALPIYRVKDDVLANLQANPITQVSTGFIPTAQTLTNDDVDVLDYRPNEENKQLDITAKIDARLSPQIDISIGGSYNQVDDRFTPGYAAARPSDQVGDGLGTWTTLNSHNNPTDKDRRYRGNFRFRHRLGGNVASDGSGGESERKASVIQNASYILQAGYERYERDLSDPTHGDNFFNYGYVGKFDYSWEPIVAQSEWTEAVPVPFFGNVAHADYRQDFVGYTAGTVNPVLAAYNNLIQDTDDPNDFIAINGDYIGAVRTAWNFHENVGTVYNLSRKRDNEYFTFNASSSFDFLPGGSEKGRHSIQFGILYEQRFLRGYDINPRDLWVLARLQTNRHLTGVDTLNVIGEFEDPRFPGIIWDQFAPQNNADQFEGNYFFERVRNGAAIDEFFNVDGLDPSQLSLDMFSAQELNDFNDIRLDYYGYDYTGNRVGNDITFDDFFTSRDENGVRNHPVGPFQPIYSAAYIQDKFTFRDIIFRLGLRVDRYDANTRTFKDPYSIYEIMNAGDFYSRFGGERPATIEDDFKVYVNGDNESTDVRAFRDGEVWYFEDGARANDGNVIFGTEVVTPRYYEERENNIRSADFDPNNAFKDYEPQVNWMPRLAFSFPISDDANFFAHYDILVQRPSSTQARGNILDYYYIEERSSSVLYNNPALRPQRTVDYEVGFQQKLSNTSAIKIAAYYKELRDMIQRRTYLYVASPINSYLTYDNQDFGTVKGFTFQYDLRRTNNLQLLASYALQFADGTGSDANSQRGLTTRGNLRTLFPLTFDERHRFNVVMDYRYATGKGYNGPVVAGKDIFADAGVNLQTTAVSGRPYTSQIQPETLGGSGTLGSINGARKPWTFRMDLRVDKNFTLGKAEGGKNPLNMNVYFRVQNLLDARNVIDVYQATGSPTDDGFLTSPNGIDATNQTPEELRQAYLDAYQWREVNPTFYSLPRRMYAGVIFEF